MRGDKTFNILLIGRSGSGKSATTRHLTGNVAIRVATHLKEITTEVQCYQGNPMLINGEEARFRVLDIPGLDLIDNRAAIREGILSTLEQGAVSLHGIIYLCSLTERDATERSKLFDFIEQLPWSNTLKEACLIPVLTKYDNLALDANEQELGFMMNSLREIFRSHGYEKAWSKRVYWVNPTKSLDFKMRINEDIRQKYEKQLERLINVLRRSKTLLTAEAIKENISMEERYILKKLLENLSGIPYALELKEHSIRLNISIQPTSIEESLSTVSVSSIGLFISKVCRKDINFKVSIAMMAVPVSIALLKLFSHNNSLESKEVCQVASGESIMMTYSRVCEQINREMEKEWNSLNEGLEFKVEGNTLSCRIEEGEGRFIVMRGLQVGGVEWEKELGDGVRYWMNLVEGETTWTPTVVVKYGVKKYDESRVLRKIQEIRKEYWKSV